MSNLYAIVDAARDPKLYPLVVASPRHACLFAGNIPEPLNQASPYLVDLSDATPLKDAWRDKGWGAAWGIFCLSSLPLDDLRRHLRKFLLAQLPDGDTVFFRFYDPRVWRVYWPSCNAEERAKWLAGVDEFVAEGAALPVAPPPAGEPNPGLAITLKVSVDIVVGGRPKGRIEVPAGAPFEFGRHGSGCRIDDRLLSRRHFALEAEGEALFVEDLGSANGTYVNGEEVKGRVAVADADRIEAGKTALTVHLEAIKRQRIGETGWIATGTPQGWSLVPARGFQREQEGETLFCSEERIAPGTTLAEHVAERVRALKSIMSEFVAERIDPSEFGGDAAGFAALLAYRYAGAPLCQYQYYPPADDQAAVACWTRQGPPAAGDAAQFGRLLGHLSRAPPGEPGKA